MGKRGKGKKKRGRKIIVKRYWGLEPIHWVFVAMGLGCALSAIAFHLF